MHMDVFNVANKSISYTLSVHIPCEHYKRTATCHIVYFEMSFSE